MKIPYAAVAAGVLACAAGCFDGADAPGASVRPGSQVYLKNGSETVFTPALLLRDGLVFLEGGGWTNLSAVVETLDPKSVEYLNLDRNAFTNVESLALFSGLKWLRLNGNRLSAIPDLSRAKSLRRVYLAGNRFETVPDGLRGLPNLTDLDLSGNPLREIPDWLAARKGLEHLSLEGTKIKSLPGDLSAWKSLKSLRLGDIEGMSDAERRRIRADLPGTAVVF